MTRLEWGEGPRLYDRGVNQGVLYLDEGAVPWNGLVTVNEEATGDVDLTHYFDGNRVYVTEEIGSFKGKVSAYTYPEVFSEYNGYSERDVNKRFGMCFRAEHGDSYRLHILYNTLVIPNSLDWSTLGETSDPSLFNWDIWAEPEQVTGARPTAHMILDASELDYVVKYVENMLYGTDTTDPRLPSPDEIVEIFESVTSLRITYHADGSYTATGVDEMLEVFDDGSFQINSPSAFLLGSGRFQVSSY